MRAFAIKAAVGDLDAATHDFHDQKTMYGGKTIAVGDEIFLFASENEGGRGLFAKGAVTFVEPTPRKPGLDRQTPRISIGIERLSRARRPLGRTELRDFKLWSDGRPGTELNFKLYRQATNKIVGLTDEAATFLHSLF
ncbi:hypothetical protein [Sphingomonas crocodyli]|uniref:EVE domain-containing protein n=1 Tax=Sphingomonas crocodyli TaxID=1979270 RepID=A0A437MAN4_9SPHN|nr:hypothetical protein [Sphingomonas crocodyli]RVT94668.1 hypothetical protein EOD43_12790 [Sphingomonas crocodyli]